MPFRYRLQKVIDFRIRKKEEQLQVVQKAQEAVDQAQANIDKNNEDIRNTKHAMYTSPPIMREGFDIFLKHLYEKGEILEQEKQKVVDILNQEKKKLQELEQAVKVLEKHKEKSREAYIEEEKKAELKNLSEIAVQKHFINTRNKKEEQEYEEMLQQYLDNQNDYGSYE